jgi:phosphoketolase
LNGCGKDPDVIIAWYAGDIPMLEALAPVSTLCEKLPNLKVCFFNIINLMCLLTSHEEHPHDLSNDKAFY